MLYRTGHRRQGWLGISGLPASIDDFINILRTILNFGAKKDFAVATSMTAVESCGL